MLHVYGAWVRCSDVSVRKGPRATRPRQTLFNSDVTTSRPGVRGRGGVWQGGKKHRSAKLSDNGQKKRAGRRSLVWNPNQSLHSWLNSVPPSSFVDWANKQDQWAAQFEQNSIREHYWQLAVNKHQGSCRFYQWLHREVLKSTSFWRSNVCVPNRNSSGHLVAALCSWARKVTLWPPGSTGPYSRLALLL